MLGSVHDAEDALQDTLLRAWRALARFEGRGSLRAWLYRIATNTCLDLIARRPKRVLPIDYEAGDEPSVEGIWLEPYPDEQLGLEQREGVELAFIAALQHLPARQRAALILRDVLGFSARETAATLETSVQSANGLLSRARRAADERLPDQSQQVTLRALGDDRLRETVESYMRALEQGDVEAVVAMLTEDATWSMPPYVSWFRGHDAIAAFLEAGPMRERWRHLPVRANGQAAVACYRWDSGAQAPCGGGARRAHVRGTADRGGHRVRRSRRVRPLWPAALACPVARRSIRAGPPVSVDMNRSRRNWALALASVASSCSIEAAPRRG